jgi:exonuclease SbcD
MKHEIFRKPWQYLNVHAIGSINRNNISEQIIEIPNKAFVIAIPYTYERNIPEKFHQSLLQEVEKRNTNNLPVIMSAHTTILGCDFSGHERADEKVVGGIESISLENIGEGFDYLALGHIHKSQFIHNSEKKARYCGTPLPITFDETYQHSVSLVEIDSHGEIPKVEIINIENPHPLVNLPEEGFQTWDKVKELLKEYPADQQDYIRLNIQVEDLLPATVKLEIENISREKQYKFCCVNIERTNHSHEEIKSLSVEEFQAEAPIEIATKYAQQIGGVFDEEMQGLFQEVLNIIEEDNRNN